MKKLVLLAIVALLCSCGGSNSNGVKAGANVTIKQKCISAADENSYDTMTKYCNRKDETGLELMEQKGLIRILETGETGTVLETGFTKTKIRLSDNTEVWLANEFLK